VLHTFTILTVPHDFIGSITLIMPRSILPDDDVAIAIHFLFVAGFLLLFTTLLQASLGEGYPLEQLGASLEQMLRGG
jgi:hypothetical protein